VSILMSLLIPSLASRSRYLSELKAEIEKQRSRFENIEILVNLDEGQKTVGQKRNELLKMSKGTYVAFIDDDDFVSSDYLAEFTQALESSPDCIGFKGFITTNGKNRKIFMMSKNFEYKEDENYYYRPINHLCPVKREIALKIGYPEINCGEDYQYCMRLKRSGLLKEEVFIDKELYHYRFDTELTATQRR